MGGAATSHLAAVGPAVRWEHMLAGEPHSWTAGMELDQLWESCGCRREELGLQEKDSIPLHSNNSPLS